MLKRMHSKLQRLLSPRSICLFGSDWAENVAKQLTKSNYSGQIFAVHPHRDTLAGIACVKTIQQLPFAPDASFIGLNRSASVAVVRELANAGAGGAVCFASGFRESDLDDGELLHRWRIHSGFVWICLDLLFVGICSGSALDLL